MIQRTETSLDNNEPGKTPAGCYEDGSYFANTNGTWHMEDSSFKAQQVLKMLNRHKDIVFTSVCDVGAGAGKVLFELQKEIPGDVDFVGYEISPQAYGLSRQFASQRCRFVLGDCCSDQSYHDIVLVLDVIEHVEDCFGFLRKVKDKGLYKLYHIPLDAHANYILRGVNMWDKVGHLHLFTLETALKTLEYTDHTILDYFLTDGGIRLPRSWKCRLANIVRIPMGCVSKTLSARIAGGYSVLVLSK